MMHLLFKLAPFVTELILPVQSPSCAANAGEEPMPCLGCNAQEDGYEGKWDITEKMPTWFFRQFPHCYCSRDGVVLLAIAAAAGSRADERFNLPL